MFCSEQCAIDAKKSFHDYECPISDTLLRSGVMQMSMRIFFQSLAMFDGSISDLEGFINENRATSLSVYNLDSNKITAKNHLLLLLNLSQHGNHCSDSPENIFKLHPKHHSLWESNKKFIRNFIRKTQQIADLNFHSICGWSAKTLASKTPQMTGIGCYPFMSLINHSCVPNINRIYVDDKMFLLVERPIEKGEQIFDCYKFVHKYFPLTSP